MLDKFLELEAKERDALLKLQVMLMADPHANKATVLSLVSETRDNVDSVIDQAAKIYIEYEVTGKSAPLIVFNDAKRHPAVRPNSIIRSDLVKRKIDPEDILTIYLPEDDGPPINTRTEMIGVLDWLSEFYPTSCVGIVAPAFHQLRSMMSILSVQEQSNSASTKSIDFVSIPAPVNWDEVSIHNQGVHTGKRHDFVLTELERCAIYYLKGDLIAPSQALEIFLAQRS